MEILRPGKLPEHRPQRYEATCPNCRCQFRFTDNETGAERRPNGRRWVNCPQEGCGQEIALGSRDVKPIVTRGSAGPCCVDRARRGWCSCDGLRAGDSV